MDSRSYTGEEVERPATQQEREIVRWLLDHADPRYASLVSQIDTLQVVSKCTCGCPTVCFAEKKTGESRSTSHLISDQLATVDGQTVGVMLFAGDECISMLEVYSLAGTEEPFGLPSVEELFVWEELSKQTGASRSI
jgi:hypothetical protein